MSISRFLSGWVKSCLHSHALSLFNFVLVLFGFCASGTAASAQAAYVQQCSSFGDYVESAACTLNGVGAGHALVIGVYVSGSATPTISSSSGTPSSVISNLADYQGSMDTAVLVNTASGNITLTATTSGYENIWITATEFSGVAASPLDTSSTASLVGGWDSTTVVSSNFSTTAASDMLWSMCYGIPSYVQWSAGTAPIAWTSMNSYSASGLIAEYGVAGSAGTYYGQCNSTTTNGGAEQASIMTVALKPASNIVATPTFSPAAGTYASVQTVTISDSTSGATIYYTTNGTTPTTASSTYSSPITVSANETLEALATHSGDTNSSVGSAAYVINGPAATPGFSPAAGAYGPAQSVTISDGTAGATIYYTTNGTTPSTGSSTYSSPITVSVTETLEAIAVAPLYTTSAVGSAAYTINGAVATPTFSPAAGSYGPAQSVTISDTTSGATIYYTTNGTTPTTASATYSSAITVSATETLEAIATHSGYSNSAVGSAAYTINGAVATPAFSPVAGSYTATQTVTITDATSGATIYYTTNGTTPTTASATYSSAITVSSTETLEAIAAKAGYSNSAVASAVYTIGSPGTPAFVQQCSNYDSYGTTATCTLNGVGAGHALLIGIYTGSSTSPTVAATTGTPTSVISNYPDYSGVMDAYLLANTASGNNTITVTTPTSMGIWLSVSEYSGVAASPLDTSADAGPTGGWDSTTVVTGNFNTAGANDLLWSMCYGIPSYVQWSAGTAPITWTAANSYSAGGLITEYGLASTTGTYYGQCNTTTTNGGADQASIITVALKAGSGAPAAATPTFSPVAGTYTSAQTVTLSDTTSGATIYYTTNGTTPSTASSVYSAPLPVSTSQTIEAVAIASGYSLSAVGSAAYTINLPAAATPGFSPAAGTYASAQTVTITDATSGASIYYTTNGSTPTTNSTHYTSTITVSVTQTLEAIAIASGYSQSAVGSAAYTITGAAATPGFSPAAGTYTSAQTVTISDATSAASIYYTTNGTTPTTASTHYTSPVTVSATETLEAIATATGYTQSVVGSAVYTIDLTTATPTFSPGAGSYGSAQTVTISDTTSGANIYYTTNGTTPTTASTHYSSPVTVSATETLEAIATASGYANSAVASAVYTIGSSGAIATVQHNSGSTESGTSLAVAFPSNVTSGHVILVAESTYDAETLDTPTDTEGNSFTQLVTAGTSGDSVAAVYAATAKSSGADTVTCNISASNNIHCHIYEVQGITTTVDQTGNSTVASTSQTVSTSAATTNADDFVFAFFTDNDNGATLTSGPGLGDTDTSNDGGDTALTEDKVVIATGVQTATATSNTSDADVNVIVALKATGTPTVSTPSFSPAPGTYTAAITVTLSDWTSGSTIYYTTNGTTPTASSAVYSSPIAVSATETIEAMATASGFANSSVASGVYTIAPLAATPTFSPASGTYTTAQTVTISDATSGSTIYYTTNGTTPTTASSVYSSAITVSAASETLEAIATANGYTQSAVASAVYLINPVSTPAFSPSGGTYTSSQTVTISDATSGSTIYYTTNGSTPTTNSSVYSSAITVSATETLEAIATHSGFTSLVGEAVYTIDSGTAGTCDGMSLGTSVAGTANMNGFLPFQNATTGLVNQWNTNIANAAIDPNNAAIQTTAGFAGESTHVNFGASSGDGGIPFMIVDSSSTPRVAINVIDYATNSDNVLAPYPSNVPIEGAAADCSGWPDTYQSDSHTNVLDRYTCWDYETYNTNRCNGLYDASEEAIWDMQNGNYRPWGWTSTDAAGLSVMAGLVKYDEAASGTIKHAIRYTMQQSKNDANAGYFVEPASHSAGTSYGAPVVEGMRIRLNSTFNISSYSAINQAILTAMQQYGMIMADNGGYLFIQGATDSRWDDSDLVNLAGIPSTDFSVIQMTPAYPGYDSVTAPTGAAPVISSFTSTATSVSSGNPVTFNFSVSGDSYDYIDMIGPVRLTSGSGSVTINPTATQTYTLYSVNQYGNNGAGAGYGITVSTPITVVVPGSTVVPPTFTPVGGTYSAAQVVTLNTTTYPYATIYYTTDGSTPTTNSTMYPQVPQPMSSQSVGNLESITISTSSTIKAIAVAPGYSSPSAVSSATYTIN